MLILALSDDDLIGDPTLFPYVLKNYKNDSRQDIHVAGPRCPRLGSRPRPELSRALLLAFSFTSSSHRHCHHGGLDRLSLR
jgi:hypothetical protein